MKSDEKGVPIALATLKIVFHETLRAVTRTTSQALNTHLPTILLNTEAHAKSVISLLANVTMLP